MPFYFPPDLSRKPKHREPKSEYVTHPCKCCGVPFESHREDDNPYCSPHCGNHTYGENNPS